MGKTRLDKLALAILFMICSARIAAPQYRDTGTLKVWTTSEVSQVNAPGGQLRLVRAGTQDGFDRVVFEFADGVPSFYVRYSKTPTYDSQTNAPVRISGTAVLEVSVGAYYGEKPNIYEGYPHGALNFPVLREIKETDFFEAIAVFALGLKTRQAFRVQTLTNPARLVVDIKQ